jgi:hypothetical protein
MVISIPKKGKSDITPLDLLAFELDDPGSTPDLLDFLKVNQVPVRYCGFESFFAPSCGSFLSQTMLKATRLICYTLYLNKGDFTSEQILRTVCDATIRSIAESSSSVRINGKVGTMNLDLQMLISNMENECGVKELASLIQTKINTAQVQTLDSSQSAKFVEYAIVVLLGYAVKQILKGMDQERSKSMVVTSENQLILKAIDPDLDIETFVDSYESLVATLPLLTYVPKRWGKDEEENNGYCLSIFRKSTRKGENPLGDSHLVAVVEYLYSSAGQYGRINSKSNSIIGVGNSSLMNLDSLKGFLAQPMMLSFSDLNVSPYFLIHLGVMFALWKIGLGFSSEILEQLPIIGFAGIIPGIVDSDLSRPFAPLLYTAFLQKNDILYRIFWSTKTFGLYGFEVPSPQLFTLGILVASVLAI